MGEERKVDKNEAGRKLVGGRNSGREKILKMKEEI